MRLPALVMRVLLRPLRCGLVSGPDQPSKYTAPTRMPGCRAGCCGADRPSGVQATSRESLAATEPLEETSTAPIKAAMATRVAARRIPLHICHHPCARARMPPPPTLLRIPPRSTSRAKCIPAASAIRLRLYNLFPQYRRPVALAVHRAIGVDVQLHRARREVLDLRAPACTSPPCGAEHGHKVWSAIRLKGCLRQKSARFLRAEPYLQLTDARTYVAAEIQRPSRHGNRGSDLRYGASWRVHRYRYQRLKRVNPYLECQWRQRLTRPGDGVHVPAMRPLRLWRSEEGESALSVRLLIEPGGDI